MTRLSYFIVFGLLLTTIPVRSEIDQEDNIEVKAEVNPLVNEKSDLQIEVKNDEGHVTESRVERSSEGVTDNTASAEVKTVTDDQQVETPDVDNSRRSLSERKSTGKSRSDDKSDLNIESDDVSERSLINDKEDDVYSTLDYVDDKTGIDDEISEKTDTDNDEVQVKSSVDDINTPLESSRSMSNEAQDAILDHKARTAQKYDENVEPVVESSEVNDGAKVLGSRRSYSGDPTDLSGFVNLGRTGNIFNEDLFPINNQNPLQFSKITSSETIMPNGFFGPPPIPIKFNDFNSQNMPQKHYDPFSSSESKPLEEFNFNPFSNAYPYAYNPKPLTTTTQRPIEINNFLKNVPNDFFPKFPPPPVINRGPKLFGDNFPPFYPTAIRPLETKLSFNGFNVPRLNRFPNLPYFYRQKCSTCA